LPAATVTLTDASGATLQTSTATDGSYAFAGLAAGRYVVSVAHPGLESARLQVTLAPPLDAAVDFQLRMRQRETVEVLGQWERDAAYDAPDVVSALKGTQSLLLTPQSVQLVPRAVLRDQAVLTLTEAVRNVAGVASDFGFNGGTQPLLVLRGFPTVSMSAMGSMSGSASYYLDGTKVQGVPVNMADVQSVEVVKGPAAVLLGRGEPGGLVNVVSRSVSSEPTFGVEQSITEFGAARTMAEAGGPLNADKTVLGRVAGSWLVNKTNRDFARDRLGAITGSLAYLPHERTRLSGTLSYTDQSYRNDFGVPADGARPAELPWSRQFNDAPEASSTKTLSALVDIRQGLSDTWSLTARALALRADTHEVDVWPYRVDLFTGADCFVERGELCRYYYYVRPDGGYRVTQGTVDVRGTFATGALRHAVLAGSDFYDTHKEGTTYLQQINSIDVFAPVFGTTPRLDRALAVPSDIRDASRWWSAYAQDVIALGRRLQVAATVRYDSTRAIFAASGTEPNRQSFVSPRVGVVWSLTDGQALYGQYQEAVNANNGRDPLTGEELDAERARQIEAGYKVSMLGGGLRATLAVYELTKRNRADYSLFPRVQTIGEARARGVELDVLGRIGNRLSAMASYAYTDAEVTQDPLYQGTRLANVPRHGGSIWARYVFERRFSAGLGAFFQSVRQGDQGNTFQLPGYARVDAMAAYSFRAGSWRSALQINANNLLNRRYYAGSHQFVKDWIAVGAPRTLMLTLRLDH
jgi:iron complex outermembrane receptor protein